MLYIVTAMYAEAAPFIKHYNLKRDKLMKRHELYSSEQGEILLLITKPGKIAAAMAVTEMLVTNEPSKEDFLVNIGVCGSCKDQADNLHTSPNFTSPSNSVEATTSDTPIFICNDILDHDTGKHYYPDMLFKHPFTEAGIETCSVVINDSALVTMPLVDMEASAIYQAASSFFPPHRMSFLKTPSDNLETSQVTKENVTGVIEANLEVICEWLKSIADSSDNTTLKPDSSDCNTTHKPDFTQAEQALFDDITNKLNLSVTMKEQLRQLFIYRKLTKGSLDGISLPDIPDGRITNQKRTILFEQFKQQFLQ